MDRMIIAVLVLALGYFAFDKFVLVPGRATNGATNGRRALANAQSIAVLPFVNMSSDKADEFTGRAVTTMRLRKSGRHWNWIPIMVSPTPSWAGASSGT